jgi:hypothetical protein
MEWSSSAKMKGRWKRVTHHWSACLSRGMWSACHRRDTPLLVGRETAFGGESEGNPPPRRRPFIHFRGRLCYSFVNWYEQEPPCSKYGKGRKSRMLIGRERGSLVVWVRTWAGDIGWTSGLLDGQARTGVLKRSGR